MTIKSAPRSNHTHTSFLAAATCTTSPSCHMTFTRHADLKRHIDTVHGKKTSHWCPMEGCPRAEADGNKAFPRKDKRDEHVRKVHKH